eukprot:4830588-Pleurochrysis_carterae.AAC.1
MQGAVGKLSAGTPTLSANCRQTIVYTCNLVQRASAHAPPAVHERTHTRPTLAQRMRLLVRTRCTRAASYSACAPAMCRREDLACLACLAYLAYLACASTGARARPRAEARAAHTTHACWSANAPAHSANAPAHSASAPAHSANAPAPPAHSANARAHTFAQASDRPPPFSPPKRASLQPSEARVGVQPLLGVELGEEPQRACRQRHQPARAVGYAVGHAVARPVDHVPGRGPSHRVVQTLEMRRLPCAQGRAHARVKLSLSEYSLPRQCAGCGEHARRYGRVGQLTVYFALEGSKTGRVGCEAPHCKVKISEEAKAARSTAAAREFQTFSSDACVPCLQAKPSDETSRYSALLDRLTIPGGYLTCNTWGEST